MSLCSACTKLKAISLCTDSIIIGEAPLALTPYAIYFKSLATGKIHTYYVTSSASKILTITLTDGFPLATLTAYEVWINTLGDSIESQENLIIGVTTATCYTIQALNVFNSYYDINQNYSSQTLEVA
jgi:hypothetical protein